MNKDYYVKRVSNDLGKFCEDLMCTGCDKDVKCAVCLANFLFDNNYRKINENEMVITKKKYEKLTNQEEELLRKIANQIKMKFYYHFDEIMPSIMEDEINDIIDEYIIRSKNEE